MTWKLHVKSLNTLLKLEPQLQSAGERTLSLYLPVRAEGFDAAHYDLLLNHVSSPYRDKLDEDQRPVFDSELMRLRTHLKLVRPAGCPAVVAFFNERNRLRSANRYLKYIRYGNRQPLLIDPVRRCPTTDPETHAEGLSTQLFRITSSQRLTGAEERGGALKLLNGQEP